MSKLMSLVDLEKSVREELHIGKENKVFYVESMEHLYQLRATMTDEAFESALNPATRGIASNMKYAYIFLYKILEFTDKQFVLCHELRHLWQFENEDFEMSSDFVPYSLKSEEVDANNWAYDRMRIKPVIMSGAFIALNICAGLGLGLLIKKVTKK